MLPVLFAHPDVDLSAGGFTVHWSTVIGLAALLLLWGWRAWVHGRAAAPRLWGLSPLEDQRLGGLIMWIPGGLFFYLLTSVIFFKWSSSVRDDRAGPNWLRSAVLRTA